MNEVDPKDGQPPFVFHDASNITVDTIENTTNKRIHSTDDSINPKKFADINSHDDKKFLSDD